MLLFDIIRDWFVQYIWGGYLSNGEYVHTLVGAMFDEKGNDFGGFYTAEVFFKMPFYVNGDNGVVNPLFSLGDWLSTTSTIIVMVALCFFFFLMVRWLFRLTAGLIQGRG